MNKYSRRTLLGVLGVSGVALADGRRTGVLTPASPAARTALTSLTASAQPIAAAEHAARIAKLQGLMQTQGIAAFLVEAGPSLEYFTGIRWWRSERTTAALVPVQGRTVVVTPYFEEPSIRESLKVDADVRSWKEDQSPFDFLADAMQDPRSADGALAIEPTTRFFIWDRMGKALKGAREFRSGEALVNACRMHKSATELALMQAANNVTLAAIRHVHAHAAAGMSGGELLELLATATQQLGGEHDFSLVLLNEASAFPHGSTQPQKVRAGSTILIDSTCIVHGYRSDISRTWVHGEASKRQRDLWSTVRRGQELALETAKPGVAVGTIDKTVRGYYESLGWSRDYLLPGLSHRTGHGIGMETHEAPYLVRNDTTPLEAGMCFSDEPGLYVPGEFGVRMEDCWYMTADGPKTFTPLAKSLEEPI